MADGGKRSLKKRGGPADDTIKAESERLSGKMQKYKNQYRDPVRLRQGAEWADRGEDTGLIDFPVKISAPDERDTTKEMKMQYAREAQNGGAGNSKFGQVMATEEDFKWLADKAKQKERVGFQKFVAHSFDLTNPADQERLERVYPDYYKQREDEIEQQAELQKTLAFIRLRGVKTMKDLETLWAVKTGRIPIPRGALWEPTSWSKDEATAFNRGIFSPKRIFSASEISADHWDPLVGRQQAGVGLEGAGGVRDASAYRASNNLARLD